MMKLKRTKVVLVLLAMAIIFTLPLFFQVLRGADLVYHLNRIRALGEAISHGDFFPKLYFNQNFGYGYASPMFYCDLFLWPVALLNCLGVPILHCYQILVFICTFLTALTTYYFLSSFTSNKKVLYLSVALYIFNPYRISTVYIAATVGEMLATIFLPLIFKSMYDLFYKNKNNWMLLGIGFAGVVLSHNITFLLSCLLLTIFLIVNLKSVIKKPHILITLLKAAILALGLSAFFLFPMLEQIKAQPLQVFAATQQVSLAEKALSVFDIFFNYTSQADLYRLMVLNPGWILMSLSIIFLWNYKKQNNKLQSGFFVVCCIGLLFLWMSTCYFPWDIFTVFNVIQFPYRFMILVTLCLVLPSMSVIILMKKRTRYCVAGLFCITTFLIFLPQWKGSYQTFNATIKDEDYSVDKLVTAFEDNFKYNASELAMGEYLPISDYNYRFSLRKIQSSISLESEIPYKAEYNNFQFEVEDVPAFTTFILPITYYKGYEIICSSNEKLVVHPYADSENSMVMFQLPKEFTGTIQCQYKATKIQIISTMISIVSLLVMCVFIGKEVLSNEKTIK